MPLPVAEAVQGAQQVQLHLEGAALWTLEARWTLEGPSALPLRRRTLTLPKVARHQRAKRSPAWVELEAEQAPQALVWALVEASKGSDAPQAVPWRLNSLPRRTG